MLNRSREKSRNYVRMIDLFLADHGLNFILDYGLLAWDVTTILIFEHLYLFNYSLFDVRHLIPCLLFGFFFFTPIFS